MKLGSFSCLLLAVVTCPVVVKAWPSGTGACPMGEPAVFGSHLSNANLVTGSLEESPQQLQLTLDGLIPSLGRNGTVIMAGQTIPVELSASYGVFTGFLIRLGPNSTAGSLAMDDDLTMALTPISAIDETTTTNADVKLDEMHCIPSGVAGVCHTSPAAKTSIKAELQVPVSTTLSGASSFLLDVTVVIANNGAGSEYYHTTYPITVQDPEEAAAEDEEDVIMNTDNTLPVDVEIPDENVTTSSSYFAGDMAEAEIVESMLENSGAGKASFSGLLMAAVAGLFVALV